MDIFERTIGYYKTVAGEIPYRKWFDSLKNNQIKQVIDVRLARVRVGNFGDCSSVGDGIFELRIHIHGGYRIFFGQIGNTIVLLLLGGIKKTQVRDIKKAKDYWSDYKRRIQ